MANCIVGQLNFAEIKFWAGYEEESREKGLSLATLTCKSSLGRPKAKKRSSTPPDASPEYYPRAEITVSRAVAKLQVSETASCGRLMCFFLLARSALML